MAGGQAYTIQGNYAVPATPDVSNYHPAGVRVAGSPSPTSISSSSSSTPSPSSSSAAPPPPLLPPTGNPCFPPSTASLLPRFHHAPSSSSSPSGMGLSMISPPDLLCPPYHYHHSIPSSACPMMSAATYGQPVASSCTPNAVAASTYSPSSYCPPTSGYSFHPHPQQQHHLHWLSSNCHQGPNAPSPLFAVSPVSSMSPTPPAPVPSSKNGVGGGGGGGGGTISLAAISLPLSFYLGGGGGGVPSQAASVAGGATAPAAYSAYSPGPVHFDVSHTHTTGEKERKKNRPSLPAPSITASHTTSISPN